MDSECQTIFISTSIIGALKPEVFDQRNIAVGAFKSPSITSSSRILVRLDLREIFTNPSTTITEFKSAYEFLPQPPLPHNVNGMTLIHKLQFADPRDQEDLPIEIMVRGDHYWHISPSLDILPSRLGWVLSGNQYGISVNVAEVNLLQVEGPGSLPR